jgi:hypothetical protein
MRESTLPSASTQPRGSERRRTPRLPVQGLLAGFLLEAKARMDIRDLSFGGFAAEVEAVLEEDRLYEVTFLPPIGENVILKARVAYCKKLSRDEQPLRYLGGFEFQHLDAHSRPAVNRLMNRVASLLGFSGDDASGASRG